MPTVDLERFHEGDREYFSELMGEYEALVHSIVTGFAQDTDTAEDWSQDVWIRVYERRTGFSGSGPFRSWLLVLARNICRDHMRSVVRRDGAHRRFCQMQNMEAPPVRESGVHPAGNAI